jgi:hypothetical protein
MPGSRNVWIAVASVLGFLLIAGVIYAIADPGGSSQDASSIQPSFPPGGPAEFLYLDPTRIATYLAQDEGGKVESEKLTHKLTQNLNAKLELKGLGEVGATQVGELLAEKNVKPTAASSFFVLHRQLEEAKDISPVRPRYFKEFRRLDEGDFVEFETSALLPPIYINAYLSVLHAGTLAAIFPKSPTQRRESTNFFKKVGSTPRAVFALQPYKPNPEAASGQASASQVAGRKPVVYLLPFTAPLLSAERSLLKGGGGNFTVLGKLVRLFPTPPKEKERASYIDSATRETWEQALKSAPEELLCRTEPMCAETVRAKHLTGKKREKVIDECRQQILEALETQTTVSDRGAVILPIAIYK